MRKIKYLILFTLILNFLSCVEKKEFVEVDCIETFSINSKRDHGDFIIARRPQTLKNRQKVVSIKYSKRPSRFFTENGNKVVKINVNKNINEVTIKYRLRLYRYDYGIATEQSRHRNDNKLSMFLQYPENNELLLISKKLKGKTENKTILNTLKFVNNNILYEHQESERSGYEGYVSGYGDCTEFSDLFAVLCRMNDIPVKMVYGYVVASGNTSHSWCEVYNSSLGWIPVETIPKRNYLPVYPNKMENRYVYMAYDRLDKSYNYSYSKGLDISSRVIVKKVEKTRYER